MKKIILIAAAAITMSSAAFSQDSAPENWFNLDKEQDGVHGVSTEKTYKTLLKGRKGQTIIVAVIDSGVEVDHEDLKDVMWTNPGEIPGNGIDDDNNGYVDDIHGWNFLGGPDGQNVNDETLEVTRIYASLRDKYDGKTRDNVKDKDEFDLYTKTKEEVESARQKAQENLDRTEKRKGEIMTALDALDKALDGADFTTENINAVSSEDEDVVMGKNMALRFITMPEVTDIASAKSFLGEQFQGAIDYYGGQVNHMYNPDWKTRHIIGDDYDNVDQRDYGNNDYEGPDAFHGTHVAGIIAASRGNEVGMDGVADLVQIMTIRAVPNGDEYDKDVANAIRYAVDNGASIINMSFGKAYGWDKKAVDEAVKHAAKNDVLLVHAAGNSSQDNDSSSNFPNDVYKRTGLFKFLKKKQADNWLEIGALSWKNGEDMLATFTNYGQSQVDVFAPGVQIYSTTPDGEYGNASGTSMASPVTAGVAAVLRSYFPTLTAVQVKDIIMGSSVRTNMKVKKPGTDEIVPISDLSVTGGIVNTYEAVKKAMRTQGKKKISRSNRT